MHPSGQLNRGADSESQVVNNQVGMRVDCQITDGNVYKHAWFLLLQIFTRVVVQNAYSTWEAAEYCRSH